MTSIRRQLLLTLMSVIASIMMLGAFATYRTARAEADEMFDYHLRQLALTLRDQAYQSQLTREFEIDQDDAQDFSIQVWRQDGSRVYLSRPSKALPEQTPIGFATVRNGNEKWRVFGLQQGGFTIQVAQPMKIREQLALSAAMRTTAPFLVMLPLLGMLIWLVLSRGLRPLDLVAKAVTTRSASALDPLPEQRVPAEILPLVRSLNDLLARLQRSIAAQREFIADAAHELRTPLAALGLQAQLAERAPDPAARAEAFADLKGGLQRATHSVQQLLTLARQEPGAAEKPFVEVKIADLVARVIADHLPLAEAKQIDLGVTPENTELKVLADEESLRVLLANLVGNAVRYTPPGGKVDVTCQAGDPGWRLEVSDSGPGIAPEERERVFDRFYRRAQTEEPGSGLGLAIVKTIADRYQAKVSLADSAFGGLRVWVEFPARLSVKQDFS